MKLVHSFDKKIIVWLVVLFALVVFVSSGAALSWEEAAALADTQNNELKSAKYQLEAYRWSYNRAFSSFLPQLSAGMSMGESVDPPAPDVTKSYSYSLTATQYLFRGLDSLYDLQTAYANYQYYKFNLDKTVSDVYYSVRLAYIDLFVAQKNVEQQKSIVARRKENTRLIQLRYESGKEDKGSLLLTKADQAESEYELAAALRELKLAQLKLSQLLNVDVSGVDALSAAYLSAVPDFAALTEGSPAYNMARYQLEAAEIAQKSTIGGFLPSVSLSGNYSNGDSVWPPDSASNSWSLNVSYSFFPGGSNLADRAIYGAQLDKAREDFVKNKKDLSYAIEQADINFKDAIESYQVKQTYLEATKTRAEISRAKYLNGLTSYYEWDQIENAYIAAERYVLIYQKAALQSEAAWHNSYGGLIK
ncbi:MAG: TolC family protein [Candidatus Margulisbacteria bacterium]|nr:TolC family protein [Candidatus Margulisiibacteriota bacterium]MBU1022502.1 TolC family protein [Candidatus Margulisiibacteriota bacterium]MBU1728486.1 TolC family protein [Candidatus Margulisiibacteriota bacterium]MBU1954633.1 TolC family protein [Candidatus Margulisiibacteriota bacterium]